ncbi:MAG: DNA-processing protein DprA [Myxococcales bacterium]|nr:DNA-processing protein DprA [Myxococcales bacterium]USN51008.1 MAG: DNA-processing protein DprA [Myxococcales bacterium]
MDILLLKNILSTLKNEHEKNLLLSAMGVVAEEWTLVEKLGGAEKFLESNIALQKLSEQLSKDKLLEKFIETLREQLDNFYSQSGFLLNARDLFKVHHIKNLPLVFMACFNQQVLMKRPRIAIVGARLADQDALKFTYKLANQCAQNNICVISGGALGVDSAAHEGALVVGGNTIVVSGATCSFKKLNINPMLKSFDANNQCVLFPYGPHLSQRKFMFVQRNRYVVALADAIVIVQGGAESGTLHTARFAKELGVKLFAIPGALTNQLSYVPNMLLSDGSAKALTNFEQLHEAVDQKLAKTTITRKRKTQVLSSHNNDALPELLELLKSHGGVATMDQLIHWSKRSFVSIQEEMLMFEMESLIKKQGHNYMLIEK